MNLVSMKVSKPVVPDADRAGTLMGGSSTAEYPWGLRINLNNDALKALGLTSGSELPPMGKTFTIEAKVSVCGAGNDPSQADGSGLSLDLQITDLGLGLTAERSEADVADKLYSGTSNT